MKTQMTPSKLFSSLVKLAIHFLLAQSSSQNTKPFIMKYTQKIRCLQYLVFLESKKTKTLTSWMTRAKFIWIKLTNYPLKQVLRICSKMLSLNWLKLSDNFYNSTLRIEQLLKIASQTQYLLQSETSTKKRRPSLQSQPKWMTIMRPHQVSKNASK